MVKRVAPPKSLMKPSVRTKTPPVLYNFAGLYETFAAALEADPDAATAGPAVTAVEQWAAAEQKRLAGSASLLNA